MEKQEKITYKQMKQVEYSCCNHIFVKVFHEYDGLEGRSQEFYGCIKYGLAQRVLGEQYRFNEFLTFEQKIMQEYMEGNVSLQGVYTKIFMI